MCACQAAHSLPSLPHTPHSPHSVYAHTQWIHTAVGLPTRRAACAALNAADFATFADARQRAASAFAIVVAFVATVVAAFPDFAPATLAAAPAAAALSAATFLSAATAAA
eukprot:3411488-Prymnesium_polylepis.1